MNPYPHGLNVQRRGRRLVTCFAIRQNMDLIEGYHQASDVAYEYGYTCNSRDCICTGEYLFQQFI